MRKTSGVLRALCIMLAAYAVVSALLAIGRIYPSELRAVAEGKPVVTNKAIEDNYLGIYQIVDLSDVLYVLHSEFCIVTVYTTTGDYAYTISVYSHKNGRPKIATDGKLLYLKDKIGNLYVFEGEKLINFFSRNQLPTNIDELDWNVQSRKYIAKGNRIYFTDADGQETCIIERSLWTIFAQKNTLELISFAILTLVFLISLPLRKLGDKGGKGDAGDKRTDPLSRKS